MLSVVIPTHNSERQLVPVLSALVPGVTYGLLQDLILVDNASTDGTAMIADAAGCIFMSGVQDTGLRLRQGAKQARGHWLLFLGPSSLLQEGWVRDVDAFIETTERRGLADKTAGTFRLGVDGFGLKPRVSEAMAAARLALLGLPKPAQGLLISRRHYDRLGGHPTGPSSERRLLARIGRRHLKLLRACVLLPEADAPRA